LGLLRSHSSSLSSWSSLTSFMSLSRDEMIVLVTLNCHCLNPANLSF
jgi:hypothetical protein